MSFFKSFVTALLVAPLAACAAPTSPYPKDGNVQLLTEFPNGTWVENLAVRSNDQILVTLFAPKPQLFMVDPSEPGSKPTLVHTFPNATSLFGITETQPDVFQVIAGNFSLKTGPTPGSSSVWTVDFSGGKAQPKVSLLTAVPNAISLNGMCTLPQERNIVLLADIGSGNVFRLDTRTEKITVAVPGDNSLTAPVATSFIGTVGVNGVHVVGDKLFATDTGKTTLGSIRINPDGTIAAGAKPRIIYNGKNNTNTDDFAVDDQDNAFVVTGAGNTVIKVAPNGKETLLAGNLNSTEIAEPTSAALSRASKQKMLFVTTAGGQLAPINGKEIIGGQVVAIKL